MLSIRFCRTVVGALFLMATFTASASAQSPESPKAAGKIRVGVAPSEAQVGQGNNAGDFGTPIRNSIVLLMSGPAVDIVALDSYIPIQLDAEAKQKQCDYILYSNVTVKRSGGGGFGKFAQMAAPMAGMAGMAGGVGGAVAGQAASIAAMAAAQSATDQAMNQLAGFNGQIKSKDDVTVGYRLHRAGEGKPALTESLKAKARTDGEDVMTPLLLKAAGTILTEVTKK